MTLNPNGKAHRMLARLAEGDGTLSDLRRAAAESRRAFHIVQAVIERGLAASNRGNYFITPRGREALRQLRDGFPVEVQCPTP